jgi:NADH-quinone oxidoreductase subunit C
MTQSETILVQSLRERFGAALAAPVEFRGEVTLDMLDVTRLREVCRYVKDSLGFTFLTDLSGVDFYGEDPRWMVVYELCNLKTGNHLRLRVRVSEEESEVPTVSDIWRTADWHERECYDMFGIRFAGHPDLRRILMWEGYPYFPLRKDFPLAGKSSELPGVAFTRRAPLEGGPFVTAPGQRDAVAREPRARSENAS